MEAAGEDSPAVAAVAADSEGLAVAASAAAGQEGAGKRSLRSVLRSESLKV